MRTINLVPKDCLERRRRRDRIGTWIAVLVGSAAVLLVAGLYLQMQSGHLQRYNDHQQELEGRLAELQRQRTVLRAERSLLFNKAQLLVAPLSANELPVALAQLTEQAPPGIVLTRVELGRGDRLAQGGIGQALAIEGYGPSESQIHAFTELVQTMPNWDDARLQRSFVREANGDARKHFAIQRGGKRP